MIGQEKSLGALRQKVYITDAEKKLLEKIFLGRWEYANEIVGDKLPEHLDSVLKKTSEGEWTLNITQDESYGFLFLCDEGAYSIEVEYTDEECKKILKGVAVKLIAAFASLRVTKEIGVFVRFLNQSWLNINTFDPLDTSKKEITSKWASANWELLIGRALLENRGRINPLSENLVSKGIADDALPLYYVVCQPKKEKQFLGLIGHFLCAELDAGHYGLNPPFDWIKASTLDGKSAFYFRVDEVEFSLLSKSDYMRKFAG